MSAAPVVSPSSRSSSVEWVLAGCALVSVATIVAIVWVLGRGLTSAPVEAAPVELGALVLGTALTSMIALVVAVPLGLLAAVHLAEFASARQRRLLEPMLEVLAAMPTVVFGLMALWFVTPTLQRLIPGVRPTNALSAGIVIGVMIVPMLASLMAAALRAVPRRLREGAWALGAGEAQTIFTIVLPAAAPGVVAAVLLAFSRALGETMIVTIAAGLQPSASLDPRVPIETLSAYIIDATTAGSAGGRALFVAGAGLFVVSLVIHVAARRLVRSTREVHA